MIVMTTGTGGTMTGVAKKLKEKVHGIKACIGIFLAICFHDFLMRTCAGCRC
jgi:hypothetical protein